MSRTFEPVGRLRARRPEHRACEGFDRDAVEALAIAHQKLTGQSTTFSPLDVAGDYQRFTSSSTSQRLDQPRASNACTFPARAGWSRRGSSSSSSRRAPAHSYVVSAATGRILFSNDLVRYDAYSYRVWASDGHEAPHGRPAGQRCGSARGPRAQRFKATFVPQSLVTLQNYPFSKNDPWLLPGATTTAGNNVRAYSDVAGQDGYQAATADTYAEATSDSTFDYAYDTDATSAGTTAGGREGLDHADVLHDELPARLVLRLRLRREIRQPPGGQLRACGAGRDPLHAETQDFSGRNNANASTPADGASPRIQMYLFGGATKASLDVAAPAPNAGLKSVGTAGQFGKDSFDLSGPVVLVSDGGGRGCRGRVREHQLLARRQDRARPSRQLRVRGEGAEGAGRGGIGIIITNVASSAQPAIAPFMGGTALDVTIPALSLSLGDGQAMEAATAAGVTVTMKREPSKDLDGALDDQIVSHEWGHVLSNRLIADGSGLDTNMAGGLGEGWADFSAQLVTVRPDDALVAANAGWNGVYPSATYATGGGRGVLLRYPARPVFDGHVEGPTDVQAHRGRDTASRDCAYLLRRGRQLELRVHNTGEVWATMLWECYAALLRDGGYTFKEAQDHMKSYLVASLKLTPPSPTLLEARDAVIAAAYATSPKDFDLFWKAFAKRGAGVGAVAPPARRRGQQPREGELRRRQCRVAGHP